MKRLIDWVKRDACGLDRWVRAHPYKAIAFTYVLTLLSGIIGITGGSFNWLMVGLAAIGVAVAVAMIIFDSRRLPLFLLAFAISLPAATQEDRKSLPVV